MVRRVGTGTSGGPIPQVPRAARRLHFVRPAVANSSLDAVFIHGRRETATGTVQHERAGFAPGAHLLDGWARRGPFAAHGRSEPPHPRLDRRRLWRRWGCQW